MLFGQAPVMAEATANIGVIGLAAMGSNLARNLAHHGNTVALFNRHYSRTEKLMAEHGSEGAFVPAETLEEFAASLKRPRTAIIMVKAGAPTDVVIAQLEEVFEPGDIIVDGGNSFFKDTIRREKEVRAKGFHFVGCGVSGGEEGALNGPSLMPGGTAESWKTLGPILESIAAKVNGEPCVTHIGTDGAGHFVKMVHNGIEYADMQVIGEAYDILRRGLGMDAEEIAGVFDEWNKGDLDSYLIEITAESQDAWRHVIVKAVEAGIPTPVFSSSLAYYDGNRGVASLSFPSRCHRVPAFFPSNDVGSFLTCDTGRESASCLVRVQR